MKGLVLIVCLLLAYSDPTSSQCEEELANFVVGTCLNSMTEFAEAETLRQRQRGCRGAYASLSCMEDYVLTCNATMTGLDSALVQLRKIRETRLKLDVMCHSKLETCY